MTSPLTELSPEQLHILNGSLHRIEAAQDMVARGIVSAEAGAAEQALHLEAAADIVGQPVDVALLEAARAALTEPGWWGMLELIDILWVAAAGLLLVAMVWLATIYLVPLVKNLPREVRELLLFAISGALMIGPHFWMTGGGAIAIASIGCVLLLGAVLYYDGRRSHWGKPDVRLYAAGLLVAWSGAMALHGSVLLGGLAVLAWLALAGTVIVPAWGLLSRQDIPPVSMLAALTVLVPFVFLDITGAAAPAPLHLLRPAGIALGGLVYLGGCLILASRQYGRNYWSMQALALVSGAVCLVLGTVYGLENLQEAAVTFFAAWLLEKFFEIPWKRHGYAWMCLAMAGLLWAGASLAEHLPELFLRL